MQRRDVRGRRPDELCELPGQHGVCFARQCLHSKRRVLAGLRSGPKRRHIGEWEHNSDVELAVQRPGFRRARFHLCRPQSIRRRDQLQGYSDSFRWDDPDIPRGCLDKQGYNQREKVRRCRCPEELLVERCVPSGPVEPLQSLGWDSGVLRGGHIFQGIGLDVPKLPHRDLLGGRGRDLVQRMPFGGGWIDGRHFGRCVHTAVPSRDCAQPQRWPGCWARECLRQCRERICGVHVHCGRDLDDYISECRISRHLAGWRRRRRERRRGRRRTGAGCEGGGPIRGTVNYSGCRRRTGRHSWNVRSRRNYRCERRQIVDIWFSFIHCLRWRWCNRLDSSIH